MSRPPAIDSLALVESPIQLLNVIELGHTVPSWSGVPIAVIPPATGRGRDQLRAMADLAREVGHPVSWHDLRRGADELVRALASMASTLQHVERLVLGDAFSGLMQMALTVVRPREVMLVDDGTATLELAQQWGSGQQLTRWHTAPAGRRRGLGVRARDQLTAGGRRRLGRAGGPVGLFTSLPVQLAGVDVVRNDFGWLRERYPAPVLTPGADLVGTSLVETGVVGQQDYLRGVAALAERYGVARYLAHRKEGEVKLRAVHRLGIEVLQPVLPLEILARRGPTPRTMVSFPSTVVHTVPLVLAGTGHQMVVCDIDDRWFTPTTRARADDFLHRVTRSAQERHGLSAVAC